MNEVVTKLEIQPLAQATAPASQIVSTDPMAMVSDALARGASPEMVDRLIAWGERLQAAAERRAFDEAIAAAKAEIPIIKKARVVDFVGQTGKRTHYRYADMAMLVENVGPIMAKHGLSHRFQPFDREGKMWLRCIIAHRGGHSETSEMVAPPETSGNKNPHQAQASGLTFTQRTLFAMAMGLAAGEDDDGRAAGVAAEPAPSITDAQAEALRKALAFKGRSEADFCRVMKRESLTDLEASRFDAALAWISKLPTPEATDA